GAVVAGNGCGHGSVVGGGDGGVEVKNDDQSQKFGRKHIEFEWGSEKKRIFFVMGLKEIGVFRIYRGRKIRKKCHVVRETHLSSFCEEWKKRVSFYHRNVYET
ncbi:hypothetical protein Csa_023731, partial [Cucumis sativus]